MLSRIYSPKHQEDGFTLIELLVVIIIIGILAAIAIPLFLDQRKLAADASVKADVRNTLANIHTWQASSDANRTKAIASTGEFTNATNGGKAAISPNNIIGISIDSTGAATVCGYNVGGKTYNSNTKSGSVGSYVFSPTTGQFTTDSCSATSTTGGAGAGATAPVAAVDLPLTSVAGWTSGSATPFTGSDSLGNYIQVNGVGSLGSNGYVAYNFDQSKALLVSGHKYVVTFKSGMTSTSGFMFGNASGVNTDGPFYSGTLAAPGTKATPTFTAGSTNAQFIIYCPQGTTLRIYGISIQDVT